MKTQTSTESLSYWWKKEGLVSRHVLPSSLSVDVCVIGAGLAGLSTAYLLAQQGLHVAVLEAAEIASGQTGRATAHLVNVLDDRYYQLEKYHGAQGARLIAESHAAAISWIEGCIEDEGIECDFSRVPGYLFLGDQSSPRELQREYEACRRAGLDDVRYVEHGPQNFGPCLEFPQQGQFNPIAYVHGLALAVEKRGGRVFTHSGVARIEAGQPNRVYTRTNLQVAAEAVVVATNTPINNIFAVHTKQAAYRSYVVGAKVPKGSVAKALFWDTENPYHYLRIDDSEADFDRLLVGGEDHKTGQEDHPEERYAALENWTRQRFAGIQDFDERWSGQVMESVDGIGFIGKNPGSERIFIATGDCGTGMTHATIAGIVLSDLITRKYNPWATLYDPSRKTLRAASRYLKENLNVVDQYADWLRRGDVDSVEEIPHGSGAIMRDGVKPVAVYRDPQGQVHRCSAVCTHLEGIVRWNAAEGTWDCPCHGSRFSATGRVIEGPASKDLPPADDPQVTVPERHWNLETL